MRRVGFIIALGLLLVTGVILGLRPDLDLSAARLFVNASGGFIGASPIGEILRKAGYIVPFGLFAGTVIGCLARFAGFRRFPLPGGRAVLFLALTLAVGPGLLVNTILKDHSHRPRPVQTQELGGKFRFRPWYKFDGECGRNCSFVSGEASSAYWTLAPALLAPPSVRAPAVAAALIFGTGVAALRMSFGGHYLSDSLISGLLTILIILGFYHLLFGRGAPTKARGLAPKSDHDLRSDIAPL
ncbi:MAG: Membrane-associated enzyme (Acid phosphatase) superfamily [Hyphomicrobiales bacterium]|nr:Membrane-associated enzyme (Acid phosphatase) superfamily [Hyphomicrobiales bacterium]